MSRYTADQNLPYFCTLTVLEWLPIFTESRYIEPILDSLRYCRANKGLSIHAFVVMPNHLHLICSASVSHRITTEESPAAQGMDRRSAAGSIDHNAPALHAVMRDFKRFTSRRIHERLLADNRNTLLGWLRFSTQAARRGRGETGLWRDGFQPRAIWSSDVLQQKLDYLHANPCRKGLVARAEDWWFSSAAAYSGATGFAMSIDPIAIRHCGKGFPR
jgi:REP element-mobilizing transposase RayT